MRTTIDDAGRIQLPETARLTLGVKPGDEVLLEDRQGELVIRAVQAQSGLQWKGNVMVHIGVCTQPIDRVLGELREERLEQLIEGPSS